jgi:hypothetical protein
MRPEGSESPHHTPRSAGSSTSRSVSSVPPAAQAHQRATLWALFARALGSFLNALGSFGCFGAPVPRQRLFGSLIPSSLVCFGALFVAVSGLFLWPHPGRRACCGARSRARTTNPSGRAARRRATPPASPRPHPPPARPSPGSCRAPTSVSAERERERASARALARARRLHARVRIVADAGAISTEPPAGALPCVPLARALPCLPPARANISLHIPAGAVGGRVLGLRV